MSQPLTSSVESAKMEQVMQHLESALSPKVAFSEDVNRMRVDADAARAEEIKAAMKIIYANVAGLTYRQWLADLCE